MPRPPLPPFMLATVELATVELEVQAAEDRREDPQGDRVVVTLDGKFLSYQW